MSLVTVAATQMACSWDRDANVARAEKLIREAAARGANVILIQELFRDAVFLQGSLDAAFRAGQASRGSPGGRAFPQVSPRAGCGAARQRVRACQ